MSIKKIVPADRDKIDSWADKVVAMLGFKGSFVTDESTIRDFIPLFTDKEKALKKINKKFSAYGIQVGAHDLIYKVAQDLKKRCDDESSI